MLLPLQGYTIGVTADRRADEQVELLTRRGARVVQGPAMRTEPLVDGDALAAATTALLDDPPDAVVLSTGVGTRGWFAAAEGSGLDGDLRRVLGGARIYARGPKAAGAAVAAGLTVAWQAPSELGAEVVDRLQREGVSGQRVAVQRDGSSTSPIADAIRTLGATTVDVPVYRSAVPADAGPVLRLVQAACTGRLDALTFTSSPAIENVFAIAESAGLRQSLVDAVAGGVRVACVGPRCADTARRHGVPAPVQPARARVGAMVHALAQDLRHGGLQLRVGGAPFLLQGDTAAVGSEVVRLSGKERAVLAALAGRAGQVVAKAELLEHLWRDGDLHTVEVTVARLRRRLGAAGASLRTVPRRGYVLDVAG